MRTLLVVAKAPVPGLAKTRLCPPATPARAADIAAAALLDTLSAVRAADARSVVALTGDLSRAARRDEVAAALSGCVVIPQRGDGLGARLANAHADAGGVGLVQIGMDTPQVTPDLLGEALDALAGADAVLGPAADGGWWALGLRDPAYAAALRDVPMSTPYTGRLTVEALRAQGLRVTPLPVLTDVDTMADARKVAAAAPATRFAASLGDFFDPALHGNECWLVGDDGSREAVPVRRWRGAPERTARDLIGRCDGPTLDIGCGPGRLTAALTARGVPALGIDTSTVAIDLTRRRGAAALRRDVFAALPGEGRWRHVLLFDGNIGIGGDPVALLRRCAGLLEPGGTALVELAAPGVGLRRGVARLEHAGSAGPTGPTGPAGAIGTPFPWARLGADAVRACAARAGLTVRDLWCDEFRWFAELVRP